MSYFGYSCISRNAKFNYLPTRNVILLTITYIASNAILVSARQRNKLTGRPTSRIVPLRSSAFLKLFLHNLRLLINFKTLYFCFVTQFSFFFFAIMTCLLHFNCFTFYFLSVQMKNLLHGSLFLRV